MDSINSSKPDGIGLLIFIEYSVFLEFLEFFLVIKKPSGVEGFRS